MALPPGIAAKTVTLGIASFADGSLASGRATISLNVNVIHTPSNRPIFSSEMTKPFVDGEVSFDLLPTDAPGLNRVDWSYKLKVEIQGANVQPEVIYFLLPTAGPDTVDLDGLVTVPSSAGIPISVDVLTAADVDPTLASVITPGGSATAAALAADPALRAASGTQAADVTSPLRVELDKVLSPVSLPLRPNPWSAPVGPNPTMVAQACQPGHGWASTGTGGTVNLNDTSDTTFGSQCITLATDGTNTTQTHVTKSGLTLDMTGKSFVLWVMCPDVSKLKSIELRLGDSTFANFFYLEPESQRTASTTDRYLKSGRWQKFTFPWSVFEPSVGTPSRAALNQVRITLKDFADGNPATLKVAGFGTQPEQPSAVCSFTLDDGWMEQTTLFRPILNGKGWAATALPIVNLIGTGAGTYMNLTQVRDLQEVHGWEIGAHAYTASAHNATGGFTALNDTDLDAELSALKKWLIDNNFTGRDYLAYPQGFNDSRTIAIARRYFVAARTQSQYRRETLPVGDRMRTRTINLGQPLTVAQAKSFVDEAVANKEWINFTAHRLAATAENGSTWPTTDFQQLCDYIAGLSIKVMTYGQALRSVAP